MTAAGKSPAFMPIRTQHEERVLRLARKYARMKLHGSYVENNMLHHVCGIAEELKPQTLDDIEHEIRRHIA